MSRFKDSSDDAVAEYYQAQRWRAEGVAEEQERIIKLLKEMQEEYSARGTQLGVTTAWITDKIISLIQGAKND